MKGVTGIVAIVLLAGACGSGHPFTQPARTNERTSTVHTVTETRPTGAAATQPSKPSEKAVPFAGYWYAHGIHFTIDSEGHGRGSWRAGGLCPKDPAPCDTFSGDLIFDGGQAAFTLRRTGPSTAAGTVLGTTQASVLPRGPLTARLDTAHDLLISRRRRVVIPCSCAVRMPRHTSADSKRDG